MTATLEDKKVSTQSGTYVAEEIVARNVKGLAWSYALCCKLGSLFHYQVVRDC